MSACAVCAGDEETCVAVARFFMREYQFQTDSYRMFAAICRVCQSSVSWYSSGPAQKFILRQIKRMDQGLLNPEKFDAETTAKDRGARPEGLDVCLLMIYGHILFASNSYNYAMSEPALPETLRYG